MQQQYPQQQGGALGAVPSQTQTLQQSGLVQSSRPVTGVAGLNGNQPGINPETGQPYITPLASGPGIHLQGGTPSGQGLPQNYINNEIDPLTGRVKGGLSDQFWQQSQQDAANAAAQQANLQGGTVNQQGQWTPDANTGWVQNAQGGWTKTDTPQATQPTGQGMHLVNGQWVGSAGAFSDPTGQVAQGHQILGNIVAGGGGPQRVAVLDPNNGINDPSNPNSPYYQGNTGGVGQEAGVTQNAGGSLTIAGVTDGRYQTPTYGPTPATGQQGASGVTPDAGVPSMDYQQWRNYANQTPTGLPTQATDSFELWKAKQQPNPANTQVSGGTTPYNIPGNPTYNSTPTTSQAGGGGVDLSGLFPSAGGNANTNTPLNAQAIQAQQAATQAANRANRPSAPGPSMYGGGGGGGGGGYQGSQNAGGGLASQTFANPAQQGGYTTGSQGENVTVGSGSSQQGGSIGGFPANWGDAFSETAPTGKTTSDQSVAGVPLFTQGTPLATNGANLAQYIAGLPQPMQDIINNSGGYPNQSGSAVSPEGIPYTWSQGNPQQTPNTGYQGDVYGNVPMAGGPAGTVYGSEAWNQPGQPGAPNAYQGGLFSDQGANGAGGVLPGQIPGTAANPTQYPNVGGYGQPVSGYGIDPNTGQYATPIPGAGSSANTSGQTTAPVTPYPGMATFPESSGYGAGVPAEHPTDYGNAVTPTLPAVTPYTGGGTQPNTTVPPITNPPNTQQTLQDTLGNLPKDLFEQGVAPDVVHPPNEWGSDVSPNLPGVLNSMTGDLGTALGYRPEVAAPESVAPAEGLANTLGQLEPVQQAAIREMLSGMSGTGGTMTDEQLQGIYGQARDQAIIEQQRASRGLAGNLAARGMMRGGAYTGGMTGLAQQRMQTMGQTYSNLLQQQAAQNQEAKQSAMAQAPQWAQQQQTANLNRAKYALDAAAQQFQQKLSSADLQTVQRAQDITTLQSDLQRRIALGEVTNEQAQNMLQYAQIMEQQRQANQQWANQLNQTALQGAGLEQGVFSALGQALTGGYSAYA
jgi:hypothetical protein